MPERIVRRVSLALVASFLTACPAPRSVAGVVYSAGSVSLTGARTLTKPLSGATVTWSCPPGVVGPAPQTLTTEYNGAFASKAFYSNMPNECELVVTKPGHLEYREKFGGLCVDPSPSGCSRVNVAIALPSLERTASNAMSAVPLDAPRAPGDVQTVLSVVVAADGVAQVDGVTVPNDDAILGLARAAREKNPEIRAVIKADSTVPHGRVIHVLDLLKQAQVQKIAFGVSPVGHADRP
jgi:biopolymer transport protein ExbD